MCVFGFLSRFLSMFVNKIFRQLQNLQTLTRMLCCMTLNISYNYFFVCVFQIYTGSTGFSCGCPNSSNASSCMVATHVVTSLMATRRHRALKRVTCQTKCSLIISSRQHRTYREIYSPSLSLTVLGEKYYCVSMIIGFQCFV